MKRAIILILLAAALVIGQAAYQMPLWTQTAGNKGGYIFPILGSGFIVSGSVISVKPSTPRKYDTTVNYDTTRGGWVVPNPKAVNLVVYANGLRYHAGTDADYTTLVDSTSSLVIKPTSSNMQASYLVTVDYDDVQ